MWVFFTFTSFLILWLGFYKRFSQGLAPIRQAFFYAAALWGSAVFLLTETLSPFHALSFFPLLLGWLLIFSVSVYWSRSSWGKLSLTFLRDIYFTWPLTEKIFLLIVMIFAGLKCFSAIMSAPNTSDAMSYHLPRVEHWMQNATVNHYPSSVLRQLYSCPWAEYVILHLRMLSGSDYFSNAVQWFSSIGSWIGVSMLAQLLGANRRGQLLSAVLAATLPMGLVQATSTQTDYVLAFWMGGFVYFLWTCYQQHHLRSAVAAGAFLGLALLTKGNAFVFAPVWILIYAIAALRARDLPKIKFLGVIMAVSVIFIIPFAMRNMAVFGKPTWTHREMVNKDLTLKTFAANAVCNMALHGGAPGTWTVMNQWIRGAFTWVAERIGFDLHHPDPKPGGEEFNFQDLSTGEDDAGNLLYVWLIVLTLGVMGWNSSLRRKEYLLYALAILGMAIFFCMVVRFNPFNSRFHLPMFVLSTALVGVILNQWIHRGVLTVGLMVTALAIPWLLMCNEHPSLGSRSILKTSRMEQYFSEQPNLILPYHLTKQVVESSGCREIGLVNGEGEWEYAWWILLRQSYGDQFRLEQVGVKNMTSSVPYPKGPFTPCILIAHDSSQILSLPQGLYLRAWFIDLPQGVTSVFVHKS